MEKPLSIPELIDLTGSANLSDAGHARRELLSRAGECGNYTPHFIGLLVSADAAIADFGYRILERIGTPAVEPLIKTYKESNGKLRCATLGMISRVAEFTDYFPLLKSEIDNHDSECRYWAANCLGRRYDAQTDWPSEGVELLNDSVQILLSLRGDRENWPQARMTLKHLGKL